MTEEEKFSHAFGKTLRDLRLKKGFTSYEEFAVEHDMDRKQYWRLENGCNCTMFSLLNILKIHAVGVGEFFTQVEKNY